jgi:hypothetical protein
MPPFMLRTLRNPACPRKSDALAQRQFVLVDVRELHEYQI